MKHCFKHLLLALLLSSAALADSTVYVDTDCANDGDGSSASCAGAPAGAGAYNSINNMISGEATDLVTATSILTVYVEGATDDAWEGTLTGFTTNCSYYVKIIGNASATGHHDGTWDSNAFTVSNSVYNGTILPDKSVWIEGIQIESIANDDARAIGVGIRSGSPAGCYWVLNNLIRYAPTGTPTTSTSNHGILLDQGPATARKSYFVNNVIYAFKRSGMVISTSGSTDEEVYLYNNTIVDNLATGSEDGLGIYCYGNSDSDIVYARNNLLTGNDGTNQYYKEGTCGTYTTSNNVTEDATSPDGASYQNKTVTFVGATDYHLGGSDTGATDLGADLSAATGYAFSDDFEGDTRSGTWDAGADEAAAAASGTAGGTMNGVMNYGINWGIN